MGEGGRERVDFSIEAVFEREVKEGGGEKVYFFVEHVAEGEVGEGGREAGDGKVEV